MKLSPSRHLRNLAQTLDDGAPFNRGEAASLLRLTAAILEDPPPDPLEAFPVFDVETEELGPSYDERPGFQGQIRVDRPDLVVGISGGWANSTQLGDGPGVFAKLAARVIRRTDHHEIDAILHADVARELGVALYGAAERAPLDQAATDLWRNL